MSEQPNKNLEQFLLTQISSNRFQNLAQKYARPYKELMAYYRCAMMEVATKFQVLNEELSLQYDHNPIESIKTRLKTPESILEKCRRKNVGLTPESIEQNIYDIAGVRVICAFPSDIYMLSAAFLQQDDILLVEKKDYIEKPKANGYRSLHLIVEIPIFLHNEKKTMKVEVQFRTIAMDWWASLEHKIYYKKDYALPERAKRELKECADISAMLDCRMENIYKSVGEHIDWTAKPPRDDSPEPDREAPDGPE